MKNSFLSPYFLAIKCSICDMTYGPDFYRDASEGFPTYYTWEKQRPLNHQEMLDALDEKLEVIWFCGAACGTEHYQKQKTD